MDTSLKMPTSHAPESLGRPVFLVLEKNPIIAADIIGTLEEAGPCHTIHIISPDGILEVIMHRPSMDAAILEMSPGDLVGSEIEASLARCGAQIVLTRGEQDQTIAEKRGWHLLARPFTDQMLKDVLGMLRTRPAAPGT